MKIALQAFAAVLISLVIAGCTGDYHREYLEDLLSFALPGDCSNIHHFTGSDFAFTSHYSVPVDSLADFISKTAMQSQPQPDWDPVLFTEQLPSPWDVIPDDGVFLYGSGSRGWNSWDMILESDSGEFWVTVYYPDMSGDAPN